MTVAVERTTIAAPKLQRLAAFALAGMALFGVVLDEYDVPHDNPQGFMVLGSGVVAGLIVAGLLERRPVSRIVERAVLVLPRPGVPELAVRLDLSV